MTNKRIVFKNTDGTCGIVIPTSEALHIMSIEQIAKNSVPDGLEWRITTVDNIPADRTFRDAWTDALPGDQIDIDMDKARSIHMDNIRKERNKKLEALDLEYIRADEDGDLGLKSAVSAKKKTLRDLPQTFDLSVAETPEQLKELWPEELA